MEFITYNVQWLCSQFFKSVYEVFKFVLTGFETMVWEFDGTPSGAGLLWALVMVFAIGVVGFAFSMLNKMIRRIF